MILSIFKGLILIFSSVFLKKHSLSYLRRFKLLIFARDGKKHYFQLNNFLIEVVLNL